jgi:hypothetical protein
MGKGFVRSAGPAGAAVVIFSCALVALATRLPFDPRPWWDVGLELEVRGTYELKNSEAARTGDFIYRAMWVGTMERDGEDFLLYQVGTTTHAWEAQEKTHRGKDVSVVTEKETASRPVIKLNYILRNGKHLDFDIVVEAIPIPLAPSKEKFSLSLPCSTEHVRDRGLLYNEFITSGSNTIRVPAGALAENSFEKRFRWEWTRQGWILGEREPTFVSSRHRAEVTVMFVSYDALRPGDGNGHRRGEAAPG